MGGLLVVAGEASADLHGAHVLAELRRLRPDLVVAGIGGDGCRAQGMHVLVDNSELSLMGFTEVLGGLLRVRRAFRACLRWVEEHRPEAALLIDFADFNLRMARALRKRGVKVVYFISPKAWAWREGRARTIGQRVDRLLVIFPFEVDFFRRHGVTAEYVGNPTLDELYTPPARDAARAALGLPADARVVALLPGSRRSELSRHVAPMMEAARTLAGASPTRFLLPRAPTVPDSLLRAQVDAARSAGVDITVTEGRATEVVAASDAAVVASGTATLETALIGTPMVVIYKASALSGLLVKLFVKLRHVSPPNILMGREIVRELLQRACTPARIAEEVKALLAPARRETALADLRALRDLLGRPGAARRVAEVVLETVDAAGK